LHDTRAEVRAVDPLTGHGEEHLLDHLADVLVVSGVSYAATTINMQRIGNIHYHIPFTRTCVTTIFSGVLFGVQEAWLSCNSTGCPITLTRTAAVTHCAVTQG